mgnify:CR=1 FL=1
MAQFIVKAFWSLYRTATYPDPVEAETPEAAVAIVEKRMEEVGADGCIDESWIADNDDIDGSESPTSFEVFTVGDHDIANDFVAEQLDEGERLKQAAGQMLAALEAVNSAAGGDWPDWLKEGGTFELVEEAIKAATLAGPQPVAVTPETEPEEEEPGQRAWETAMGLRGYAGSPAEAEDRREGRAREKPEPRSA